MHTVARHKRHGWLLLCHVLPISYEYTEVTTEFLTSVFCYFSFQNWTIAESMHYVGLPVLHLLLIGIVCTINVKRRGKTGKKSMDPTRKYKSTSNKFCKQWINSKRLEPGYVWDQTWNLVTEPSVVIVINIILSLMLSLPFIITAWQKKDNEKTILMVNKTWHKAGMSWHVCKNWKKHNPNQHSWPKLILKLGTSKIWQRNATITLPVLCVKWPTACLANHSNMW
jgi:hypothetical protein